jgi:hypothetical protein
LHGHRGEFRNMMQRTQSVICQLLRNGKLQRDFVRAVQAKRGNEGKKTNSGKFDLSLEVAARATGQRKLASKRARVLDYLRETGVKVADTGKTIEAKGMEALYAESIEARREKARAGANGSPTPMGSKEREHKDDSNARPSKPEPAPASATGSDKRKTSKHGKNEAASIRPNDREVPLVTWVKLSERDQILESKVGTVFTSSFVRVPEDEGDIRLRCVMIARSATDDWED